MKRLHWLGALTASAMLFSAAAHAEDRHDRRNWDRDRHHSDRWDRGDQWRGRDGRWDRGDQWRGRDGRWDDRRYHHSRPGRYWAPPGHRYRHGYRHGYRDGGYRGGYYRDYHGGRYYDPPRYHRSSVDGTLILTFPIW